jgi:hypothetical protein
MKPHEVGFDGAEGLRIRLNGYLDAKYLLRRGVKPPKVEAKFKNELLWYCLESQEPKALYADHRGRFYELDFRPIDNPFATND